MPDHGVGEKKKGSHVAALLSSRGENAVRDASLWMSRLLLMRAKSANEVRGTLGTIRVRIGSAERPSNRPWFAIRLIVAEKLAAPVPT